MAPRNPCPCSWKKSTKTGLVEIKAGYEVKAVNAVEGQGFQVATSAGYFKAESVVVASGGLSIPTLGGSGIGYDIAKQFGHHVYPTRAGLVPFTFSDSFKEVTARLSGNAVEATLSNDLNSFTRLGAVYHRGHEAGQLSLRLSNYWNAITAFKSTSSPPAGYRRVSEIQKKHPAEGPAAHAVQRASAEKRGGWYKI